MVIMLDKGFTIEDLLPESITLNMPSKNHKARIFLFILSVSPELGYWWT